MAGGKCRLTELSQGTHVASESADHVQMVELRASSTAPSRLLNFDLNMLKTFPSNCCCSLNSSRGFVYLPSRER